MKDEQHIRINISLYPEHIKMLMPFIIRHKDNFSAAVREAVQVASIVQESKVTINRTELKELVDEFYTKLLFYTEGQK